MPSRLRYYSKDPNGKQRGRGYYYRRKTEDGEPVYSKYSRERDMKKKSKGWRTDKVGLPKTTVIPHTSDGRLRR